MTHSLTKIRQRLLDLSKRNQLLNYREKARTVQLDQVSIDKLFNKLVQDGKSLTLTFRTPTSLINSTTSVINVSSDTVWSVPIINVSHETLPSLTSLPASPIAKNSKKSSETSLPTIHSEDILERRCRRLAQESRTAIEETGSNLLYLAMGFLEWSDPAGKVNINKAPLILIPVKLERAPLPKVTSYTYLLSYREEEIETNLSLAEKLAADFNLTLPEFTLEIEPSVYLEQVTEMAKAMPGWQVLLDLRLDFFSFAKLLMYKDLDDQNWPEGEKLSQNVNLRHILGDANVSLPSVSFHQHLEDISIDTDPLAEQTPLVLDADSSQHTVLIEALWKKSHLVVEGPPGTGKSQTIANLIAAAMSQGQTVLFVAEKKAALDVVKTRLDQVGLGEFCLELHSHKTHKTELHADLKKRLEHTYHAVPQLEQEQQELATLKQKLLAYSQLMNTAVGPNDEKIYELFWAVERLRGEMGGKPQFFEIDNPRQWTRPQFDQSVAKLTELIEHYQTLSADALQHWQGFQPLHILPGDEETVQKILTTLLLDAQEYQAYLEVLREETQFPLAHNLEVFQVLTEINIMGLSPPPKAVTAALAIKFLDPVVVTQVKQFQNDRSEYQQLIQQAIKVMGRDLPTTPVIQNLAKVTKQLEELGFGNDSPEDLKYFLKSLDKLEDELQALVHQPESIDHFLNFLKLRELAAQAPHDLVLHKHPDHALQATKFIFEHARQTFLTLAEQWQSQRHFFLLNKLPNAEKIAVLGDELRKHQGQWFSFLSADYRHAKREIHSFLVSPSLFKTPDLLDKLHTLVSLKQKIALENQREQYRQRLGPLFTGLDTDWEHLGNHVQWAQQLSAVLGSEESARELLATKVEPHTYILKSTAVMYDQWLRLDKAAQQLKVPVDSHFHIKTFVEKLLARRSQVAELISVFQTLPHLGDKHILSLQGATQNLLTAGRLRASVERNQLLNKIFGKSYQGLQTDPTLFMTVANWVTQLKQAKLPQPLLQWLLQDPPLRTTWCQDLFNRNQNYLTQLADVCRRLSEFGKFNQLQWLKCKSHQCTLAHIADKARACQTVVKALPAYATVYRLKQEVDELGLSPITDALLSQQISPEQTVLYFQYAIYHSLARELLRHSPELATFTRTGHENLRQKFAQIDKQVLQDTRLQLAYLISQRLVPQGNGSGKVASYTEKCLLDHELNKQKRHLPIRSLIKRAGSALQALKPCFMMSPLSVAQYLPAGEIHFDLLIFDEASQVRPEEALNALARGQQWVVVGDPKQLPPTSFFEQLNHVPVATEAPEEELGEDGMEPTIGLEEHESILDMCLALYPKRRLRWHFRSEHESLIAFSNHYFYNDELIVFPSPQAHPKDAGIRYHYVEQATYLQGRNQREAEAVVAAVAEHFRHSPQLSMGTETQFLQETEFLSMGVATFNLEQAELIWDLLDKRCQTDPWLEAQLTATEETAEPFFVKNLENVQGDERDVIFVSTTYGPDPSTGRIYQRFGPISNDLGWRRLNVIFTRARKRLELFTSMRASDLPLHSNAKLGMKTLKAYLEYVETGGLDNPLVTHTVSPSQNDFDLAISKILQEHGYKTVTQVGVAGFRIGLAVCHPQRPDEYILGIECDGADYHAVLSIRDRDRLKPEILTRKGWKIHRIWATDWFKNREVEIDRLLRVLSKANEVHNVRLEMKVEDVSN